jgi:lysophospholipase L1-like esterase
MTPTAPPEEARVRTILTTAVAAAALLLSGCTQGSAAPDPATSAASAPAPSASSGAPSPVGRYVALGDSYAAGPLIPTTDLAGGCARSDHNYGHLLADALDVHDFVDVTCSGATTRDLTHVQRTFGDARIPPQMRAVTAGTSLVTLTIGGNDLNLFSTLVATCERLRPSDPQGSPCARRLATRGPDLDRAVATISGNVSGVLETIRRRAPDAKVLLVGYLRLVPDRGSCVGLPLAAGDYATGRQISEALERALRQAARRTGTTFVDMYSASAGHDICADHPWVNGNVTVREKALAYHPFASGMRADARAVLQALGR